MDINNDIIKNQFMTDIQTKIPITTHPQQHHYFQQYRPRPKFEKIEKKSGEN